MCGIAGICDLTAARPVDEARLTRMNQAQRHRGPDGAGVWTAPGVGLAHRRLAIIDLEGGRQPLGNEDGSVWLVFNGEIYNFQELHQELLGLGHRFATRSDTEVILHAWESWGAACVTRLRGMFAFALWDQNRDCLFLARDRLGMKPLYYTLHPDGWFAFASELAGITVERAAPWPVSMEAMSCYFALGYVPDPLTIHPGIHKLAPGHHLSLRRGAATLAAPVRYWDPVFDGHGAPGSFAGAAHELRERLQESVRLHMIADVPVATFLSGGIDSAGVSALMAHIAATPPEACTISFDDPDHDETVYATQVAARHGLRHHVSRADPARFDLLDQLARHYGEPFADPSALPTWLVCGLARQQAKVVLSGDGGDENLAGYSRYRFLMAEERVRALLPHGLRRILFGVPGRWYPKLDRAPRWLRARSTLRSLGQEWLEAAFQSVEILPEDLRCALFTPQVQRELQDFRPVTIWRQYAEQAPDHPLSRLQYLDLKGFLAGRVLVKVDRASMAHGLEVRAPLLDYPLVEWLATLPPEWKLHRGVGKHLLKEALRPLLPPEILFRPKQGFNLPLAGWLRGPLAGRLRERVLGEALAATGWFEPKTLRRLVERHLSGVQDFSGPLWALLMFESFLRQRQGSTPVQPATTAG
ncbi:MAG: amidotransferase 1, exosortase A system-associated [Magnetococcales bacterium]|nr:amidotransferase 1, exosortase A system-associated [Magnetococcales bacterium]